MINLTSKIQMTYSSGFIVIKLLKPNKDGVETLSNALTYRHAVNTRKGIFKHIGVDVPVEQIEQAKAELIKQKGMKHGEALAKAKLAKLNKVEG